MGLFGKKETPVYQQNNVPNAEEQQKNELKRILEARYNARQNISGCKGKGQGESFLSENTYLFHMDEESYLFEPEYTGYSFWELEKLKKAVDEGTVVLPKSEYSPVLESTTLVEQAQRIIGEISVEVAPITVAFTNKSSGEKQLFCFENTPDNVSPYTDFFRELGVKNFYNITNIPEDIMQVRVLNGDGFLSDNTSYVIYRSEGKLSMIRPPETNYYDRRKRAYLCEIPIDEILYYRQEGALRYEQQVTGSGGGSTSYTGAIVGGLLFGMTGALIGSRANEKETKISTETIEKDTRILNLAVTRNGILYRMSFQLDAEDVFDWILPDKEYNYVISKRRLKYEAESRNEDA